MNFLNTWSWLEVVTACLTAMLLGIGLAKRQAKAFEGKSLNGYPAVTFSDYGDMRFLHLGTPAVQGSMRLSRPFELHLEYVQRMMAWLLFVDLTQVHTLKAMQLGLGAASLTKFCHAQIGMHTTALELNPHVIDTCRQWFHLPNNSTQLQVVQGNAADIAQHPEWLAHIDVLQVDLYDAQAQCPVLDSESFYRDCHQLLTEQGCMVVNVFGQASNLSLSMKKISAVFGEDAVWSFTPTVAGNAIVLAFRSPRLIEASALQAQAYQIENRWALPASKWLSSLAPANPMARR